MPAPITTTRASVCINYLLKSFVRAQFATWWRIYGTRDSTAGAWPLQCTCYEVFALRGSG
ncbi:MAG: hypothetical protein DWI67_07385 [Chloroflexi bacterium]|nr:MAG: hypothetical protein DWI67_07385 [Chloroflexota bacterium]